MSILTLLDHHCYNHCYAKRQISNIRVSHVMHTIFIIRNILYTSAQMYIMNICDVIYI